MIIYFPHWGSDPDNPPYTKQYEAKLQVSQGRKSKVFKMRSMIKERYWQISVGLLDNRGFYVDAIVDNIKYGLNDYVRSRW